MIILASKSIIRHQLLTQAAISHQVCPSPLDEAAEKRLYHQKTASDLASALATAKALALTSQYPDATILGADQTLEFQGQILNKCETIAEAKELLLALRGNTHALHAAISIASHGEVVFQHCSTVRMHMRTFSDEFLDNYLVITGDDILRSVGCYAFENHGIQLFDRVEGDYHAILGLPLLPLLAFLRQIGELKT